MLYESFSNHAVEHDHLFELVEFKQFECSLKQVSTMKLTINFYLNYFHIIYNGGKIIKKQNKREAFNTGLLDVSVYYIVSYYIIIILATPLNIRYHKQSRMLSLIYTEHKIVECMLSETNKNIFIWILN